MSTATDFPQILLARRLAAVASSRLIRTDTTEEPVEMKKEDKTKQRRNSSSIKQPFPENAKQTVTRFRAEDA